MADLMKLRRRILMNTPHLAEAHGSSATFKTFVGAKLKRVRIGITPVQAGSGTASPTNIRNISGTSQLTVHNGAATISTLLSTALYGGAVDLATGELTEEYTLFTFDGSEPWIAYGGSNAAAMRYTLWLEDISGVSIYGARTDTLCSHFQIMTGNGVFGTLRYSPTSTRDDHSATYIAVNDSGKTQFGGSRDAFTAWLKDQSDNGTPVQLLVKLTEPVTASIAPQVIKPFKGANNIWSDAGDVEVIFWTH